MSRLQRLFRRPQKLKPPPFTDAQIAERAHTLWQARQASGKPGTAADDWEAAKASLLVEQSLPQRLRSLWSPAQVTEAQKLKLERVKVWITGFGILATVLVGVGLYLNYQQGQERLVTERFAKAVEQLGSKEPDVRIGAIASLERLAKDSPKNQGAIREVLAAFVRHKSPLPQDWHPDSKQVLSNVTHDVQSALTVIVRQAVKQEPQSMESKNQPQPMVLDPRKGNGAQGLTPNQVKAAYFWYDAHYSPNFRQQLERHTEVPKPSLETKP